MLRKIVTVFFLLSNLVAPIVLALKCFQGLRHENQSVEGAPIECMRDARTCVKVTDLETRTVNRGCQSANCSLEGTYIDYARCQNSTQAPFETVCCCYGDGCNSAPGGIVGTGMLITILTMASAMPSVIVRRLFHH